MMPEMRHSILSLPRQGKLQWPHRFLQQVPGSQNTLPLHQDKGYKMILHAHAVS